MATLERILCREFSERSVSDVVSVGRGNHKQTQLVNFADGGSVVVQRSDRPAALRVETTLARAVRAQTDVPVAAVLAEGRIDGVGYVVAERVRGDDLHEQFAGLTTPEQRRIARAFGGQLAACHRTFSFDGYGPVTLDGESLTTSEPEWESWFRSYLAAGLAALPESLADLRSAVEDVVKTTTLPSSPPARLFPWDVRPGNALYAGGETNDRSETVPTALLDWASPLAADPALSVAKTAHLVCDWYVDDPEPLRSAFREGYRERRSWPTVPRVYRLAAVVQAAVDSNGVVTRPGYPEREGDAAVAFHRDRLKRWL